MTALTATHLTLGLRRSVACAMLAAAIAQAATPSPARAATAWQAGVGAQSPDLAVQVQAFFPSEMTVNTGDRITWTFASAESHTVTFLNSPTRPPAATAPVTPDNFVFTGTEFVNSGRMTAGQTYSLTFAGPPGDYPFTCLVHGRHSGTLHVQANGATYPHDQAYYDQLAQQERSGLLIQALGLAAQQSAAAASGPPTQVIVGSGLAPSLSGGVQSVQIARFFAAQGNVTQIKVGETVTWTALDPATAHTVTFGPLPSNTQVATPNVTNGRATLPTSPTGQSVNSGFLGQGGGNRVGTTFSVTFAEAGVYPYVCALHGDIGHIGTVVVGGPVSGFSVASQGGGQVGLSWHSGTAATYRLTRFGTAGQVTLPAPSATTTSATDNVPGGTGGACYQIEALNATGAVASTSDFECAFLGIASPTGPRTISIQMNESNTATVNWAPVVGATSYVLVPLGTSRAKVVTSTGAQDSTAGVTTCYVVIANGGNGTTGLSDAVCGIPGAAH